MSFELYKKRLLSYGNDDKDVVLNNTQYMINKSFADSFGYSVVKINNVDTEVVIVNKDDSTQKELLLRPNQTAKKGATVLIDTQYYLVTDFNGNGINQKAKIKLCNNALTLKGETTKVIVGHNDFGEPIYEEVSSSDISVPCIVETTYFPLDNKDEAINLPQGRIRIIIPYIEHKDININKHLIIYGENYKIIGIDYTQSINKEGLIIIIADKVVGVENESSQESY
ncbi:hypothetical protein ABEV41_00195 [Geobacillus thermodenitrificans]|uniref:hypothetical protein n=1 Tax=Geobacillus thermodenitrificans TaxID=33940 RepID=UPI003D1E6842